METGGFDLGKRVHDSNQLKLNKRMIEVENHASQ